MSDNGVQTRGGTAGGTAGGAIIPRLKRRTRRPILDAEMCLLLPMCCGVILVVLISVVRWMTTGGGLVYYFTGVGSYTKWQSNWTAPPP